MVGREPPFHVPVFVLTHQERDPLTLSDTTFTFVTGGIESALEQARTAVAGKDVTVGGGADVINQYRAAGLVDELELNIVPLVPGGGPGCSRASARRTEAGGERHPAADALSGRPRPPGEGRRPGRPDRAAGATPALCAPSRAVARIHASGRCAPPLSRVPRAFESLMAARWGGRGENARGGARGPARTPGPGPGVCLLKTCRQPCVPGPRTDQGC